MGLTKLGALSGLIISCFLGAGCGSGESSETTGDCEAQIRVDGHTYTAHAVTALAPSKRYASADESSCADVGSDSAGSEFDEGSTRVQTWSYDEYPPDAVLGVPLDDRSWRIFVEDSVSSADLEEISENLDGQA